MKNKNIIFLWLSLFFYGILPAYTAPIIDQLTAIKTVDYKLNLAIDYENDQKGARPEIIHGYPYDRSWQ